ncbi:MAG: helix-turn-helix domain-containing protein [Rhodospirillaceae bacterium]
MQLQRTGTIDQKLRTREAAAYLGVSSSFLEKLRVKGGGCVYSKIGRVVIYSRSDLDCFAEARKRCSTSEARS